MLTGTSATFTITVTNTGNTALTNVVVTDPSAPQCASSGALAVGEQASYQCTVANVTEGFTNTAYVSGWFEQVEVTDNDGAAVTVNAPAIAVEKAPNLQTIASGATATFTITVTNTGTVTLHDISVADPLTPGCVRADLGSLAPGESTVAYTCTTAGLTAGFTNVASATGHYGEGGSITASDDAVVSVTPPPPPPSDTYGASATMCSPTGVITTYTATGFTQTGANDALAAQIAGLSAPVNGACGPTETVVTPLPATVEEVTQPVEVTPLPATVPMPAKVIPPKAAQAGDGATAPVPPAAGWILLLAGSLGVLVTARKLIQVRG